MGVMLLKRKLTSFQIIILGFSGVILFRHLPFNVAVFQPQRTGNAFLGCIVYFYLSSLCNRTHYT